MRNAKSKYFCEGIEHCSPSDPKNTWKLINTLLWKNHKSTFVSELRLLMKTPSLNLGVSRKLLKIISQILGRI